MTDPSPEPTGHLRPVSAGALALWALAGLALGWAAHPLLESWLGSAPLITWLPAGLLFFAAAVLAVTARATHQAMVGVRERPPAHEMVNRFVLARACALVGALVAGGYAGYALSWVGVGVELASERMWRSGVASIGGVVLTVAAVFLERACRVRSDDDEA